MRITEVRVKLSPNPADKLLAYCSITIDDAFVVRDLKLIDGGRGRFVAMPSRKLTDHCPVCHTKNQLRARFCSECGTPLAEDRSLRSDDGRARLYADIAHPINPACRDAVQKAVEEAYAREIELAGQPGYVCTYDDYHEDRYAKLADGADDRVPERPEVSLPRDRAAGRRRRVDAGADARVNAPNTAEANTSSARRKRPAGRAGDDPAFGDGLF